MAHWLEHLSRNRKSWLRAPGESYQKFLIWYSLPSRLALDLWEWSGGGEVKHAEVPLDQPSAIAFIAFVDMWPKGTGNGNRRRPMRHCRGRNFDFWSIPITSFYRCCTCNECPSRVWFCLNLAKLFVVLASTKYNPRTKELENLKLLLLGHAVRIVYHTQHKSYTVMNLWKLTLQSKLILVSYCNTGNFKCSNLVSHLYKLGTNIGPIG